MDKQQQQEIMRKLQEPFPPECIEWRVGSTNEDKTRGLALAYVTNRAIQTRLDEVFGPFGWQNEFQEWKSSSQICGISVWFEDKGQWITKWDGADDSQMEAVKGGLSDAMKRAACQWGIGRYLYQLEPQWVPIKQVGKSFVLCEEPPLPDWALPEAYQSHHRKPKIVQPDQQEHAPLPHHHERDERVQERVQTVLDLAARAGRTEEYVIAYIREHLHKDRIEDLSPKQYDALVASIEKSMQKVV